MKESSFSGHSSCVCHDCTLPGVSVLTGTKVEGLFRRLLHPMTGYLGSEDCRDLVQYQKHLLTSFPSRLKDVSVTPVLTDGEVQPLTLHHLSGTHTSVSQDRFRVVGESTRRSFFRGLRDSDSRIKRHTINVVSLLIYNYVKFQETLNFS